MIIITIIPWPDNHNHNYNYNYPLVRESADFFKNSKKFNRRKGPRHRVPPQELDARHGHPCSPCFNIVNGIHVLFGTFMCLLCFSTQALTAAHNQFPLRLDKPREFSRTPRSASATEGCQEGPRESRSGRVMSHDKRTCPEASTWRVQFF